MEQTQLLSIENLSAWYQKGKPVLHELSLTLDTNKIVGLIGLNGAGKTTLLNTMSGLHSGYSLSEFMFDGNKSAFRDNHFKQNRYIVFSEDSSFAYYTFDEYLAHVFSSYGKKGDKDYIDLLAHDFGFESYRKVLIGDLSMGNRRKVFLITGFALRPALLLLDEPVNGLDFESTEALYRHITDYKQYGTVLFSSHILESICLTCDRVLILENGNISRTFHKGELIPESIREVLKSEHA